MTDEEFKAKYPGYGNVVPRPSDDYVVGRAMNSDRNDRGGLTKSAIDDLHFQMINSAHDKATMSRMREEIFVNVFLPVLSGQVFNPEISAAFINGCGGLGRSAIIVDNDGTELFVVPPLVNTDHIKPLPDDVNAVTMGTIVSLANMLRVSTPHVADNSLKTEMANRINKSVVKGNSPHFKEWEAIFNRYGIRTVSSNDDLKAFNEGSFDLTGAKPQAPGQSAGATQEQPGRPARVSFDEGTFTDEGAW